MRLSDGLRPVRLQLDSGTNTAKLFNTSQYMVLQFSHNVPFYGSGLDGAQRILSALPPQDVEIGPLELPGVPFFSLTGIQKDASVKGFDWVYERYASSLRWVLRHQPLMLGVRIVARSHGLSKL